MQTNNKNIMLCEHCGRIIETKEDLVVAFYFFTLSVFHNECYGKGLKNNVFLSSLPLNGNISIIATIILSVFSILVFFFSPEYYPKVISGIIAIICLLLRIYIWFNYESKFD